MKNSVVYLTRRCPRKCTYCAIRNPIDLGKELSPERWVEAFQVLDALNVEFNLILGNEPWLLGNKVPYVFSKSKIPYALYTSCPEPVFSKYREMYFGEGNINNLSAGVDFPYRSWKETSADDSFEKSQDAWRGFQWVKKHYPDVETHATITVQKSNFTWLPEIVTQLTKLGVFSNINFIHWNKGGGFDFFSERKHMETLLFHHSDHATLRSILDEVLESPGLLQNPEMLHLPIDTLVNMKWHCKGDPYGGPTIDADGSLRVCGYRKGIRTSKFTIFDLPRQLDAWKDAVHEDAMECPGCSWSCAWMYNYWKEKNPEFGTNVFIRHARNDSK